MKNKSDLTHGTSWKDKLEEAENAVYQSQQLEELLETARREAVEECYVIFLTVIKEAKNKFPGHKEFELVVDIRDIEKSLDSFKSGVKGEK